MKEKQELHCHNCNKYVQFEIDTELDGNHVLECPNCKHEHCRVVKNGIITDDRWDQRNGQSYYIQFSSSTPYSVITVGGGSTSLQFAWYQSSTSTATYYV